MNKSPKRSPKTNHRPPRFALWLLRILCRDDYREEVVGDLQEVYEWRLEQKNSFIARYRYVLDVLSAIRFYKGGRFANSMSKVLIFSFIKSSFRNFKRHAGYTALNIFGLAIGLSAALFILEYVSDELSFNNASQADRLYRVSNDYYRFHKKVYESSMTFSGVGPAMERDLPEVTEYARLYSPSIGWGGAMILTRPDKPEVHFKEHKLFFADPAYLDFFDVKVVYGSNELGQLNTVMLTEPMAIKYFGSVQNTLGKTLRYNDNLTSYEVKVNGIFKKPDFNLQVDVDILISYGTRAQLDPERFTNDWGGNAFITFVKVTEQADPTDIEQAMSSLTLRYKPDYKEKDEQGEYNRVNRYFLTPVSEIHLHSSLQNEVGPLGDANTIKVLEVIALFIVIIAWINFINLSTAKSVDRAREVGVRKVMGARRNELTTQFLVEAILINLLAAIVALGLVTLLQPIFDQFVEKDLSLWSVDLARFGVLGLIIFVLGTFISGLYPALVISSHSAVNALKGKARLTSGATLRRILITFQLMFSSLLIIATLAIDGQLRFMNEQSMGFDMDQVLIFRGPVLLEVRGPENIPNIKRFKEQALSVPGVQNIGTTTVTPGQGILRGIVVTREQGSDTDFKSIERVVTSNDFLSTLKVNFLAGRDFDQTMEGYEPMILNAAAARELGFASPTEAIGARVYEFTREERLIVGVIDDYHHESLNRGIDPMYFVRNEAMDTYYAIRLTSADVSSTLGRIEDLFKEAYPGNPAEYYFLDQFFDNQYKKDKINRKVFSAFAIMAIIVACLGLYGLSSFSVLQRTKEIGVRKVLGASIINLFLLLSREVFSLVLIGFLLAVPLAYFGVEQWLNDFAYHMDLSALLFLIPLVLIVTITLMATGNRILRVALTNPVHSLRYE